MERIKVDLLTQWVLVAPVQPLFVGFAGVCVGWLTWKIAIVGSGGIGVVDEECGGKVKWEMQEDEKQVAVQRLRCGRHSWRKMYRGEVFKTCFEI
jgi:hypothetical protein